MRLPLVFVIFSTIIFVACRVASIGEGGYAAIQCSSGETACSGICVDLQTDPNNCGSCGAACAASMKCGVFNSVTGSGGTNKTGCYDPNYAAGQNIDCPGEYNFYCNCQCSDGTTVGTQNSEAICKTSNSGCASDCVAVCGSHNGLQQCVMGYYVSDIDDSNSFFIPPGNPKYPIVPEVPDYKKEDYTWSNCWCLKAGAWCRGDI